MKAGFDEITVEMAVELRLIPDISPYQKTWYGDRYKTNEEFVRAEILLWSPYGYDEKTRTVRIRNI